MHQKKSDDKSKIMLGDKTWEENTFAYKQNIAATTTRTNINIDASILEIWSIWAKYFI